MNGNSAFTEEGLGELRERVALRVSGKRLLHTLGVEEEFGSLAVLFGFTGRDRARCRAAALLHDLTKQLTPEEQAALCARYSLPVSDTERRSPKLYHALTGAAVAADEFAPYCDERIIAAHRRHTLGDPEMTLFEALLYLADYIEPNRTFGDCVTLRRWFYGGLHDLAPAPAVCADPDTPVVSLDIGVPLFAHLFRTLLLSYDMTIRCLINEGAPVHTTTVAARNALLSTLPPEDNR